MYRVVRSFRLIKLSYRISSKIVKMLTQKTNLDGLFSYLIYAEKYLNDDDEVCYRFRTQGNINDTCRSVAGCFKEKYIEPNMKLVIDTINAFENGED